MNARALAAILLLAVVPAFAGIPATQTTSVIEYYNETLDHYFMTANPAEAADLDNGVHAGWVRTGHSFLAIKAGAEVTGSTPICRFYGRPDATPPLDSHFYSASPDECIAVQARYAASWQLESREVFRTLPVDPITGSCPADSEGIHRLWNKRSDSNHRYTDDEVVFDAMVAKGYVPEGDGNRDLPIIFCAPAGDATRAATGGGGDASDGRDPTTAPPGTPACTVSSSSASPMAGTTITLTTSCTPAAATFAWTHCASTTASCGASSAVPGLVTYSVTGRNAAGTGNAATIDVTWTSTGGTAPICTIDANTTAPQAGGPLTLTANCSQTPTRYDWMTCSYLVQGICNLIASCPNTAPTCTTTQGVAGYAHYALEARNGAGISPRVGIDVEWGGNGSTDSGGVPVCTLGASNNTPLPGTTIQLDASCSNGPTSYSWTNCSSAGSRCSATAATTGTITYSVTASNARGTSAPATVQVSWHLAGPPACTLSASNMTPMAGTSVTLAATCSDGPTNYVWTGCASSTASCVATSAAAIVQTYSVAGINGSGAGAPASVTVHWQPRPADPPSCTVSSNNTSPHIGDTIVLTASCNNVPTSYAWTNCSSTGSTCNARSSTTGPQTYSVQATNVVGTGPSATVTINWQQPELGCGSADVIRATVAWGSSPTIYTRDFGGLRAGGIAVVAIVIPPDESATAWGRLQWAEYVDPRGDRQVTLSRTPCDFRSMDPSGSAGPLVATGGVSGDVYWNLGARRPGYPEAHVVAGATYYVNLRQTNGCGSSGVCNLVLGLGWY